MNFRTVVLSLKVLGCFIAHITFGYIEIQPRCATLKTELRQWTAFKNSLPGYKLCTCSIVCYMDELNCEVSLAKRFEQ